MTDIFISYSQKDKVLASELAGFLKDSGYDVWWDYDLVGGVQFRDQIKRQLAEASVVIVIWTPNSVESNWVLEEADEARDARKLLPVRTPELEFKHIPLGFRQLQTDPLTKPEFILRSLDERKIVPSSKPRERKQVAVEIAAGIIDADSVARSDEIAQWAYIKHSTKPEDFFDFVRRYPASDFIELARSRISALEVKSWQEVKTATEPSVVSSFISSFPGGAHGRDAQRLLYNLEDAAWSKVDKNDPVALRAHRDVFPESFSRAWIETRLAELEKERLETEVWDALRATPSRSGIEDYIRRFPLGRHVDQARSMLAPLELTERRAARWLEIKDQSFSEQLQAFIDEFGSGTEVDEARAILTQRAKRKEDEAWAAVKDTYHPADLLGFLVAHPDAVQADAALDRLAALPKRLDEEAWSIASRTKSTAVLQGYIAALPHGMGVAEARRLLGETPQSTTIGGGASKKQLPNSDIAEYGSIVPRPSVGQNLIRLNTFLFYLVTAALYGVSIVAFVNYQDLGYQLYWEQFLACLIAGTITGGCALLLQRFQRPSTTKGPASGS